MNVGSFLLQTQQCPWSLLPLYINILFYVSRKKEHDWFWSKNECKNEGCAVLNSWWMASSCDLWEFTWKYSEPKQFLELVTTLIWIHSQNTLNQITRFQIVGRAYSVIKKAVSDALNTLLTMYVQCSSEGAISLLLHTGRLKWMSSLIWLKVQRSE